MKYYVKLGGQEHEVDLDADGIRVDGQPVEASLARIGAEPTLSAVVDGRSLSLVARRTAKGSWKFLLDGIPMDVEAIDERTRHIRELSGVSAGPKGPQPVRAPMPGMVVRVEVEPGEEVQPGQGLVIVEAMKMENELKAVAAATVASVLVEAGQAVEKDQILMAFAAREEDGGSGG